MTIAKAWLNSHNWSVILGVYRVGDDVTFALVFFSIVVRWT
jgi:hypothetical protein